MVQCLENGVQAIALAQTTEKFDAYGEGDVRYLRSVDQSDQTPLYSCPPEVLETLKNVESTELYTFYEEQRYIKSFRSGRVSHLTLLILDSDDIRCILTWKEARKHGRVPLTNALLHYTASAKRDRSLRDMFIESEDSAGE